MKDKIITLAHGSGARLTQELIAEVFASRFMPPALTDAITIDHNMVVTTDAHVVKPIFFPGGDIGRLSVTGTVNDIAVSGAKPLYLLAAFIIEEGFPISDLNKIAQSMQSAAEEAGVKIIAGDTKVVEKHNAEGIYITTTGVGMLPQDVCLGTGMIKPDDNIIVNGNIGDHTIAIINARNELGLMPPPKSDCAPLNGLIAQMLPAADIHFIRDATRGGIATILNEVFEDNNLGMIIDEASLPIGNATKAVSDLLGLDPLYMANEGIIVTFATPDSPALIQEMKNHKYGINSKIIGTVTDQVNGVFLRTEIGSLRPLPMLHSDPLPRIC